MGGGGGGHKGNLQVYRVKATVFVVRMFGLKGGGGSFQNIPKIYTYCKLDPDFCYCFAKEK